MTIFAIFEENETSRSLKIVHTSFSSPTPPARDPANWLARVAFEGGVQKALTAYGEQVVFYHIDHQGEMDRDQVRYIFTGYGKWELRLPVRLVRRIARLQPDAVLVHGLIFPWQVMLLARALGPGVKIVCQHHAERPFRDFRGKLARWADSYVHAYLFASRVQGKEWVDAGQIASLEKVHEVIGSSSIFSPSNRSAARARLGMENTAHRRAKIYLWIGDLDRNKDPMLTARAFATYASRHPDVALYMIFRNDLLIDGLRTIAETCKAIHLVGRIEHALLQDWFNSADFIISSSHYEGSGIAVCEALSCGCVPILTNLPSFRTMSDNARFGLTYSAGDEEGLLRCLETSYEMDAVGESRKVLSFFERELSFSANARKIAAILTSR